MVSVLIPTKGRPDKLRVCVKSIDVDCEILILATNTTDIPQDVAGDDRVEMFFDKDASIIQAQNFMAGKATGNLMPTCDDVEYLPGSIKAAEIALKEFDGYGVIGFNVTNMKCNDDAFVLVGRKWYEKHGLFFPEYKHFYADTELGDKAKDEGRFKVCKQAKMKNYHPQAIGNADYTHTHRRSEKLAHDEQVYRSRLLHR